MDTGLREYSSRQTNSRQLSDSYGSQRRTVTSRKSEKCTLVVARVVKRTFQKVREMPGITITHPDGTPTTAKELATGVVATPDLDLFVCNLCGLHAPLKIMDDHVKACPCLPKSPSNSRTVVPEGVLYGVDGVQYLKWMISSSTSSSEDSFPPNDQSSMQILDNGTSTANLTVNAVSTLTNKGKKNRRGRKKYVGGVGDVSTQ